MKGKNMNYDITDYLKDDKELQKVVIQEFLNEIAELKAENERLKQIPEQYNAYIRGREQQLDAANAKIEKLIRETVILKKVASSAQRDESITAQAEIILKLKADNERLKEEKSKLLSKCIDKQCRINELINIVSTKEFTLKVNGKKYEGLNGINKAKLFINNENAVRDKYIQKLENKMSDLQCKFYENCKEVVDAQKQIDKYRQTLQEIKAIAEQCMNKDTCYDCEYFDDCYIEDAEIPTYDICKLLIQKITKAESEG